MTYEPTHPIALMAADSVRSYAQRAVQECRELMQYIHVPRAVQSRQLLLEGYRALLVWENPDQISEAELAETLAIIEEQRAVWDQFYDGFFKVKDKEVATG